MSWSAQSRDMCVLAGRGGLASLWRQLSAAHNVDEMLERLKRYILFDLLDCYSQMKFRDENDLIQVMKDIFARTRHPFVILLDEWDCLFREYKRDGESQKKYLDFLRAWLKDQDYVALQRQK